MNEDLSSILSSYLPAKKDKDLYSEVRSTFKQLKSKLERLQCTTQNHKLLVDFGTGQGNKANVPWLAIMDRRITTTTQKGVYCAFLLKANMNGFYLTITQGVGKTANDPPNKARLIQLRTRAVKLQEEFTAPLLKGFTFDEINLEDNRTGKAYEAGTIVSKYFPINQIPTDKVLINEVEILLEAYQRFVESQ